eukprot:gene16872-33734_t
MDLEERFENLPAPVPVRARKEAQWDELEAELARLTPAEVIDEEIRYVSSKSFQAMPSNFLFFPVDMLAEHRAHAELSERVARAAMLAKPSREVPGAGAAASTPNSYGSIAENAMVAAVTAVASATTEASGGFTYPWQAPPMYKAILTARMNELRKLDLLGHGGVLLAEWTALVAALDAALRYERVHRSPPKLSAKQKRQREKEERKAEKAARREKEAKEKANAKTNVVKRPKRTWSFFQKQQTHALPIRSASEVGQAAGGVTPNNASADDALDADQRSSASTSTSRATSRGSSTWSMLSGDDSFDQSARNLEEAGEVGGGLGDRAANVVGNDDIDDEGILSLARKMVLNGWMDPLERLRPSAPVLMFRGDNGEDESEVEDTEDGVGLAHLGTDGGGGRGGGVDGGDGGNIASNKVAPLTNGDGGGAKTSSADSSASSSSILTSATSVRKDSGQGDSPSNGGGGAGRTCGGADRHGVFLGAPCPPAAKVRKGARKAVNDAEDHCK